MNTPEEHEKIVEPLRMLEQIAPHYDKRMRSSDPRFIALTKDCFAIDHALGRGWVGREASNTNRSLSGPDFYWFWITPEGAAYLDQHPGTPPST